ncbi:MAG: thymidine kinase [Gammaproteobacteria bacterium]|nr:thymidine kinase [Gammaproteobacteria bacterium]
MAKLYFYYSAMNAGKSTTLLQSNHNYRESGMNTLLFTPALDHRYGIGKITSRIGLTIDAIAFESSFDFFHYIQQQIQQQPIHCVLVDEAQFLNKAQVFQLTEISDQLNIPVLTYGLRSDYMGEPFEGSQYLLIWAEELSEIKTVCHCGRKATMNMRIDKNKQVVRSGNQVSIGGNEQYVAVCHKHLKDGKAF